MPDHSLESWRARIREAAGMAGHALETEVVDELASHALAAYDAACARGLTTAEAASHVHAIVDAWIAQAAWLRRPARRPPAVPPAPAQSRKLAGLAQDVRYAARLLVRQRAFGLLAIATIALAIGVMTTLFSVAYGVLVRPLPWPEPERLIRLTETHVGATRQMPLSISNLAYLPWMEQPTTIEGLAAWSRSSATLAGAGDTERVLVASATPSLFALLRATPVAGQVFTREDEDAVVLSFGFWQERFGGDRSAIGRTLTLNGKPLTITGVMPRDFAFPDRETRLWRPLAITPVLGKDGRSVSISTFSAMARLRPGVTPDRAAAEATARARTGPDAGMALMAIFGSNGPAEITAEPVLDALTKDVRPGLIALVVAVSLLLLTAIANIASLQLARATTRYREMAIRAAIGAGTSRLVQQLLVENVLVAAAGGAAGLLLSAGLHRLLPSVLPPDFPRLDDIGLGGTVAAFALAVTGLTGVLLGVLPALHLRRLRLAEALTDNSGGAIGGSRTRARTFIMTGQVAIACTLLVGAALLMRSFWAMAVHDRGFDPDRVLTARLTLPDYAFTPKARFDALDAIVARAQALPGATRVALTTGLPLSNSENLTGFTMPSLRPPVGTEIQLHAVRSVVTVDYFASLGMRLAQGRTFQPAEDSPAAPKVVIVNRTFAAQYLPDEPIGARLQNFMRGDGVTFEVIGVVDDIVRKGLSDITQPEIYSLLHQSTGPAPGQDLVLRAAGDPTLLMPPLRALVKQVSPSATLDSLRTMDDRIAGSLARPRLYAALLTVFAISSLAIASVGLFGVLSYTVAQRTREIALRRALGARPFEIFGLVFVQGVTVTLTGLVLGLGLSLAGARYLTSMLYGVSPTDLPTFAAAALAIAGIAAGACLVPAFRAIRIDPLGALRV